MDSKTLRHYTGNLQSEPRYPKPKVDSLNLPKRARSVVFLLMTVGLVQTPKALAKQSVARNPGVRLCKVTGQESDGGEKAAKRKKGSVDQGDAASANACVEVHSSTLDVQENLEAFVREQHWQVSSEETSETLWNFSLELSQGQLLLYTKADSGTQRVHWRAGKAVVLGRTTDLGDGYTRTMVSAQFEGFGESDDKFATQRTSWTMQSSGKLEAALIGALQKHFSADH